MQLKHATSIYIREILWRSFYIVSFLLFIYIFISYLIITVNPASLFIDPQIFAPNYLRIILGLAFFLAIQGWQFLKSLNKIEYQSPWQLSRTDKILTICSAVILSYIFGGSLSIPSIFAFLIFTFLLIGSIFLIPQLLNFYLYMTFRDLTYFLYLFFQLKAIFISAWKKIYSVHKSSHEEEYSFIITKKQIKILTSLGISLLIITFMVIVIAVSISKYATGQTIRENQLRKTFHISSIEPEHTTPGRTAKLIGYNFNIKSDFKYNVLSDDGIVLEIVSWDKDLIEFVIPLSFSEGVHKIWIVRPTDELHREQGYKKSNKISLEVHSRFALLPDVGDSKFDRGVKKIKKLLIDTYPQLSPLIFSVYKYD